MISACIIGISGFGKTHYEDLMREVDARRCRLVGATVINQDEEREKCSELRRIGCPLFTDYRAMLDACTGRAEICFIPTGIHQHRDMTVAALDRGINVFVEKPLAATLEEVRAIQDAERRSGKFAAVGYQVFYGRETHFMKDLLLSGRLGSLRSIKSLGLWPRDRAYYARNRWAGRLRADDRWVLDSPFNNALSHQLALMCFLAGDSPHTAARLRTVQAELYHAYEIESADTASLRIVTSRDLPITFVVSHCSEAWVNPDITIEAENATVRALFGREVEIRWRDGRAEHFPADQGRGHLFDALEKRLRGEEAFVCSTAIAAVQTVCVEAAHRSGVIHAIPREWRCEQATETSSRIIVQGLDALAWRAWERECMFSEAGAPWGAATTPLPEEARSVE